jgi:hypothetical protein
MGADFTPDHPKTKLKMGLGSYMKPTPTLMRKIGDGLLAVSTFVTGSMVAFDPEIVNHKGIAIAVLCIGAVGKFMTNLFSEE